MPIFFAE